MLPNDEFVELEGHTTTSGKTYRVDVSGCMKYIIGNCNPVGMLKDPVVEKMKDCPWRMACAEKPVDLFDEETWPEGDNYKPIKHIIHTLIAAHHSQNQRVENHIKMVGTIRKTGVEEARASALAMLHSFFMR